MKIKFAEKAGVEKRELIDRLEENQTLQKLKPNSIFNWKWKVTVLFLLILMTTVLLWQTWVSLYFINVSYAVGFTPGSNFVFKDAQGKIRSGTFSWRNCGTTKDAIQMTYLSVTPDPVDLSQNLSLTFQSYLDISLHSPVKVKVEVERHFLYFWIPIPCDGTLGSCTYDDVCTLIPEPCPDPFPRFNLPCRCPVKKGVYELHNGVFNLTSVADLIPEWLVEGTYYSKALTSKDGVRLACYEFYTTIV